MALTEADVKTLIEAALVPVLKRLAALEAPVKPVKKKAPRKGRRTKADLRTIAARKRGEG